MNSKEKIAESVLKSVITFPSSDQLRKFVALFAIGRGLIRINSFGWDIGNITLGNSYFIGIILTITGLALLLTSTKRLTVLGRVVAAVMAGIYAVLAVAAWPAVASVYGFALFTLAMIVEAAVISDD